jgi:hypothetical protein
VAVVWEIAGQRATLVGDDKKRATESYISTALCAARERGHATEVRPPAGVNLLD